MQIINEELDESLSSEMINFINDEFVQKYEDLNKNKIIFNDEIHLANHINEIWDDFNNWWNRDEVQNSLNKFNDNLNKKSNRNSISLLKSSISKNL